MTITGDILQTYRRPRAVILRKLAAGQREDRALATLMAACVLNFVAQWPALSRAAHLDPDTPLDARLGGALMGAVFLVPLIAYAIAGISHLVARAFGGKGTPYGARLALFWSMLAISPLLLLHGLVEGMMGSGGVSLLLGLGVLAAFLYLWSQALMAVES
ncbi:YIP1 family protein [Paracoccaceae bacterium Fryx2]|nr:YIP1 family protein [Paracoccaceae bacterium Fryx2]